MRHLLEVLRKDFEEPELDKKESDLLDALLPQSGGKQMKTKEDNDMLPYASLIKYCDTTDYTDASSVFTTLPSHSPEKTVSATKTNENDEEGESQEKRTGSPCLSEHVTNNAVTGKEDPQNQIGTTVTDKEITNDSQKYTDVTNDEGFYQDQAEVSYDGQPGELEDLGRRLSESLHVSSNTVFDNVEPASEQHRNTAASVSDDEF